VPEKAVIYERDSSAFVVYNRLKVMLEDEYSVLQKTGQAANSKGGQEEVTNQIIREIVIPEIEKEVNEGKNFANLRQIANSMVLATWYKQNLKQSLLGQVYVNQSKTKGVEVADKEINNKIYNQYLEAFQTGVYNYIKEDYDPKSNSVIPRKYFSGGSNVDYTQALTSVKEGQKGVDRNMLSSGSQEVGRVSDLEVNLQDFGSKASGDELAKAEKGPVNIKFRDYSILSSHMERIESILGREDAGTLSSFVEKITDFDVFHVIFKGFAEEIIAAMKGQISGEKYATFNDLYRENETILEKNPGEIELIARSHWTALAGGGQQSYFYRFIFTKENFLRMMADFAEKDPQSIKKFIQDADKRFVLSQIERLNHKTLTWQRLGKLAENLAQNPGVSDIGGYAASMQAIPGFSFLNFAKHNLVGAVGRETRKTGEMEFEWRVSNYTNGFIANKTDFLRMVLELTWKNASLAERLVVDGLEPQARADSAILAREVQDIINNHISLVKADNKDLRLIDPEFIKLILLSVKGLPILHHVLASARKVFGRINSSSVLIADEFKDPKFLNQVFKFISSEGLNWEINHIDRFFAILYKIREAKEKDSFRFEKKDLAKLLRTVESIYLLSNLIELEDIIKDKKFQEIVTTKKIWQLMEGQNTDDEIARALEAFRTYLAAVNSLTENELESEIELLTAKNIKGLKLKIQKPETNTDNTVGAKGRNDSRNFVF
ncbi:MAG: hypothetical protein HQL27_10110, partial [Candidatus Omnitrophica bacterium]|nr:hypothetical protein [Candidatus Omnitrophota bacterium]